jgi:drug/metabolite transporter (DMT)-like permease
MARRAVSRCFGSALTFYLWAFALERTTPTRVAISITVNPVSLVGATLLGEPLRWNLAVGIVTVFIGIWVSTTQSRLKGSCRD